MNPDLYVELVKNFVTDSCLDEMSWQLVHIVDQDEYEIVVSLNVLGNEYVDVHPLDGVRSAKLTAEVITNQMLQNMKVEAFNFLRRNL